MKKVMDGIIIRNGKTQIVINEQGIFISAKRIDVKLSQEKEARAAVPIEIRDKQGTTNVLGAETPSTTSNIQKNKIKGIKVEITD